MIDEKESVEGRFFFQVGWSCYFLRYEEKASEIRLSEEASERVCLFRDVIVANTSKEGREEGGSVSWIDVSSHHILFT